MPRTINCWRLRFWRIQGRSKRRVLVLLLSLAKRWDHMLYPNVQIDGYVCRTNHVPAGAQRGFGIPQVTFGHESVMDELAELLDLSPFEIRERNAFRAGSCLIGGQPLEGSVPALDCLRAVMKGDVPAGTGNCRGSGLALSFKSVGYAGSKENIAQVSLEIDMEGS